MAELRYRWGVHASQQSPAPPQNTRLVLLVEERMVWQGDVTEQLDGWARGCALAVVPLWDCPDVVRQYLETGTEQTRLEACCVDWGVRGADIPTSYRLATLDDDWDAAWIRDMDDALVADSIAARSACEAADSVIRASSFERAAHSAAWAVIADARAPDWVAALEAVRNTHASHLRLLLLQRVLPENLWPLIGGDEGVLCDALLEGRHG